MIIEFAVLSRSLKSGHMASLDLWLPLRCIDCDTDQQRHFDDDFQTQIQISYIHRNFRKRRRAASLKSRNSMTLFAVERWDSVCSVCSEQNDSPVQRDLQME